MKYLMIPVVVAALGAGAVLSAPQAEARGCIRGAVVGGVAGHYAGHHGLLGAAAGCAVGHHLAARQDRDAYARNGYGSPYYNR